jgi:hypothetical protein
MFSNINLIHTTVKQLALLATSDIRLSYLTLNTHFCSILLAMSRFKSVIKGSVWKYTNYISETNKSYIHTECINEVQTLDTG